MPEWIRIRCVNHSQVLDKFTAVLCVVTQRSSPQSRTKRTAVITQATTCALGLVNACDFEQSKHIEIIVFAICWRLSAFKSPSHEKSIFLKIRSFFSFKFFQGHNWLTNYPDSEFHGHWKTVTLSSISQNLSKHWRFLAFWLSLCFESCLLFLVCHDTAFLFSTRAMTTLGWLPNAQRDIPVTSWFNYWLALNLWKNDIFVIVSRLSV